VVQIDANHLLYPEDVNERGAPTVDALKACIEGERCGYAYVDRMGDVWRHHEKIGHISEFQEAGAN
jgi:hypothetical protein